MITPYPYYARQPESHFAAEKLRVCYKNIICSFLKRYSRYNEPGVF